MRSLTALFIGLVASLLASPAIAGLQPRVHLVAAGINDYPKSKQFTKLAGCVNDATSIAEVLGDANSVVLLTNEEATHTAIWEGLEATLHKADGEIGRDMVIFYFSGHSVVRSGELYLLPSDAGETSLYRLGIPISAVLSALSDERISYALIILETSNAGRALVSPKLLDEKVHLSALSACGLNEPSVERAFAGKDHGVFTRYFVEGLRGTANSNHDDKVSLREAYEYAYREIAISGIATQRPCLIGTIDARFPLKFVR